MDISDKFLISILTFIRLASLISNVFVICQFLSLYTKETVLLSSFWPLYWESSKPLILNTSVIGKGLFPKKSTLWSDPPTLVYEMSEFVVLKVYSSVFLNDFVVSSELMGAIAVGVLFIVLTLCTA